VHSRGERVGDCLRALPARLRRAEEGDSTRTRDLVRKSLDLPVGQEVRGAIAAIAASGKTLETEHAIGKPM
jgi:hypothetical protein